MQWDAWKVTSEVALKMLIKEKLPIWYWRKEKIYLKGRCKDNKEKELFLKNSACLNPPSKAQPIYECVDKGIIMLEKMKNISKEQRMDGVCCVMHFMRECSISKFQVICPSETVQYFEGILEEILSIIFRFWFD